MVIIKTHSIVVRVSEAEAEVLKAYAQQTKRTQSDIVREFIRSLAKKVKAS